MRKSTSLLVISSVMFLLFGLLPGCDDTTSSEDDLGDDTGMDVSSCSDPDIECCQGDVEGTPVCEDDVWSCPAGFDEVPVGSCGLRPDMSNLDAGDMECTDPAPNAVTCCQGDVETSLVCQGGSWTCPSGYNQVPVGMCGGDTVDDTDMNMNGCSGCENFQWCNYPSNECGMRSEGMCEGPPIDCLGEDPHQVCGCDGMVYPNGCQAAAAGVDIDINNPCTAPLDTFKCGEKFCASITEVCRVQISDVGGFPDTFACEALADGCNPASCDCYADDPCGGQFCMQDGSDIRLICPGG